MSSALAGRVGAAMAGLDGAERHALERRERDEATYAFIAAELDVKRERVADLLVAARLKVAESVDGNPAPERLTPQCGPARRVIAAHQDGESVSASDLQRAGAHIEGCEPCQAARRALLEARLACRAWSAAPIAPRAAVGAAVSGSRRARMAALAVAAVLALMTLIAVIGGGDSGTDLPAPSAPPVGEGSADADAPDVVPPPGDEFCAPGEPRCE